jgi:polar amino acid transport system permease protein
MFGLQVADIVLLLRGIGIVLALFASSLATGLAIGGPLGLLRSGPAAARWMQPFRYLAGAYSFVFRGVPAIVQFLYIYYAPYAFGIQLNRFFAAVLALSGYSSASFSEIIRAAVDSVPAGQWLAARSMGMTYPQLMRYVIGPQGLSLAIPPSVGFSAQLIKQTSIASIVGLIELTFAGNIVSNREKNPLAVYAVVGLAYFALAYPLSALGRRLETKVTRRTNAR